MIDFISSYAFGYTACGLAVICFAVLARCWLLLAGEIAGVVFNAEILMRKLIRLSGRSLDSPPEWLTNANRVLLWMSLILITAGIIQLLVCRRHLMRSATSIT